jgi:ketosteroid isomerase-like protein
MNKPLICLALFSFFAAAAAFETFGQESRKKSNSAEAKILAELEKTAVGWNEGNLEKYLAVYTADATEMRKTGPAGGVEAIEETMKNGFWKTGRPVKNLRYESVVVRMLGKTGALVTGKYVLSGAGKPDRTGWFTTVWQKTKNGWEWFTITLKFECQKLLLMRKCAR